jgi:hypothetical protein
MAEWERAVTALEKRSMTLAGIYSHARLASWDDRGVDLAMVSESLQASLATDPDNIAKLKAFLAELTGATIEVRVRKGAAAAAEPAPGDKPQASIAELENERRRALREKRELEARSHPITAAVVETFGAAVKEVKTDG